MVNEAAAAGNENGGGVARSRPPRATDGAYWPGRCPTWSFRERRARRCDPRARACYGVGRAAPKLPPSSGRARSVRAGEQWTARGARWSSKWPTALRSDQVPAGP